jgi:hypothetical protein
MDVNSLSQNDMAALLAVTTRTLRDWEKADIGLPRNEDGSYPGPAVIAWEKHRHLEEEGDLNPVQELARKNKALADKTEMEIAVKAGELGAISQVAEWYAGHIRKCKARLVQIPDAVGQFVDPRNAGVVVAEVRRLLFEALAELAAGRPRLGGADSGGVGAAADSDGEPVGGPESPVVERGKRRAGAVAHQ